MAAILTAVPDCQRSASSTPQEQAKDRLVLNGLDGDDYQCHRPSQPVAIGLTMDGGDGDNLITGSQGADTLLSGKDNDVVTGGGGNDTASARRGR